MAVAIYNGINHKFNCAHFIKDCAYEEKDKAIALTDEVQQTREEMREKKLMLTEGIKENFDNLTESISQIEMTSEDNAKQTSGIYDSMTEVDSFAGNLKEVLSTIEG